MKLRSVSGAGKESEAEGRGNREGWLLGAVSDDCWKKRGCAEVNLLSPYLHMHMQAYVFVYI